jgi:radical SAM superfamily enzyme YgiQ (UPF0313 family)
MFAQEKLLFSPATKTSNPIAVVFAFPNTYTIGITSLGYQVIWAKLSLRPDVAVTRYFTDIQEKTSHTPELMGLSVSWELDYINILQILEELNIPIHSSDRGAHHPIIFGGGPVLTANPEPFATFFDVILLGDGEELLDHFIDAYQEVRGADREQQLVALAQVPGVYIPSLYQVTYQDPQGPITAISPLHSSIPPEIKKQTYRGNVLSCSSVVTPEAAWENIYMVEVVRSCPEMCRFCLASYLTLPFRNHDLESSLLPAIETGLKVTDRIGLLGASVTQHPEFETLLDYFDRPALDGVRLSIASVRTNTVTPKLAQILTKRQTNSITIAVESGSETMRAMINKKLTNEEILEAAVNAKQGGLKAIKFYGMVGLPGETQDDLEATVAMLKAVKNKAKGLKITFGCSTFVPKSHTPFQWLAVDRTSKKKLSYLQKQLRSQGIDFRPESYSWSVIQALIAKGDRRLTPLLELARHYGDTLGSYKRAFKELKSQLPPLDFYVHDRWSTEQILPWHHLAGPLPLQTLQKHLVESEGIIHDRL